MAEKSRIKCPDCGASGTIDISMVPEGRGLNCPSCGADFALPGELRPEAPAAKAPIDNKEDKILVDGKALAPPSASTQPTPSAPGGLDPSRVPFEFRATAGEYFKIWIVNIALTIATLGVYSAWAKVRKNRYLYASTLLKGSPFEYLAEPGNILKGRVIVFVLFAVYTGVGALRPSLEVLFGILLTLFFPWLVIKSMKFRTRNTSYRNISFNFEGTYGAAAGVYIWYGFLIGITLGIAYPSFVFHRKKFIIENSRYGCTPFSFKAKSGYFYKTYFKALLLIIIPIALLLFVEYLGLKVGSMRAAMVETGVVFSFSYLLAFAYIKTRIDNYVFNNTSIGENRLASDLRLWDMVWIYFSNMAVIALSLGFMIPWATVRMKRYRTERLSLITGVDFDRFVVDEKEKVGSLGEEAADFLDIDIGI